MKWCSLSAALVLVLSGLSTAQNQRDARFFHTRQFWDGFERGLSDAGSEIQKRLNSNLETTMDNLNILGKSIGDLSVKIENQVQDSLPDWLKDQPVPANRRESMSPEDAPIEAIEGTLGMDGLDDGLEVYFAGDSERDELPEPHIIPIDRDSFPESSPDDPTEDAEVVPPPRTGGPLFDLRFGFQNRFPMFPRMPAFPVNPFFMRGEKPGPWWRGENVCHEKEEINDEEIPEDVGMFLFGSISAKSCNENHHEYTCVTRSRKRGISSTVKETYKCCHGYIRESDGCTQVNMVPLDEALEGLELTDFLSLCENAGVMDLLHTNNLTIFAPSNEAVQDFTSDLMESNHIDITDNEVFRRKRQAEEQEQSPQIKEVVYSHMVDGFTYSRDLQDELILQSMATDSTIRINIYSQPGAPILTANCARITKVNQHSSNGVVHSLDRVMQPAVKSIADIITADPQFSVLKKLMSSSGMLTQLREDGQFTLLAPTDAAFSTMSEEELNALIETSSCLPSVLKNHILPNVICSSAITNAEAKTLNLLNKYLMVELQESGKMFVEGAQIVAKDIMATNGVIHIIDKPILPTEVKPVVEILKYKNLTKFLELIELAELTSEFDALNDATVFAPSNEALDRMDNDEWEELKNDKTRLQETIRYHITKEPFASEDVVNNHHLDTESGHPLRVNLYRGPHIFSLSSLLRAQPSSRMHVTAGCGMVSMRDATRACGASVHVVDSFLEPPKQSVLGTLEDDIAFSIFNKMVKESSLAEELSGDGPFTILAPSDHVFKTLPEEELASLLEDAELKDDLVKRHVLREHICCSGITPVSMPFQSGARTAHGSSVHLHQTPGGLLKAGHARITHCAKPSSNGLVHTVNNLYVEPHVPQGNINIQRWDSHNSDPFEIRIPFMGGHF